MWKWLTERLPDVGDERLRAKVRDHADRLEQLERTVKALKLEWEESYDKLHHLMARVTKRAKALETEKSQQRELQPLEAAGDANEQPARPQVVGTHARLMELRRRHGVLPR